MVTVKHNDKAGGSQKMKPKDAPNMNMSQCPPCNLREKILEIEKKLNAILARSEHERFIDIKELDLVVDRWSGEFIEKINTG